MRTPDDFTAQLRMLRVWAGNPSMTELTRRIHQACQRNGVPRREWPARSTIWNGFQPGRRRPNPDLIAAIVEALINDDEAAVAAWRLALRVALGEADAASQVSAADRLPDDLADFVGRQELIKELLETPADGWVLEGMAGVGKTSLAVRVAHCLRERGDLDGPVLAVNLRGFDPAAPPADPGAVLQAFLRLLGLPGERIPHGLDQRIELYRRTLAGSKALVVLDNAASADQIRALLPGTNNGLTLITSRVAMRGLDGLNSVPVEVLGSEEALELLRVRAGAERIASDPGTARTLVDLLGRLPLALSVIGGHIQKNPDWTLLDYPPALTALAMEGGVRAALTLSDRSLPPGTRQLLRLLALHPSGDCDAPAAAALAGQDLAATKAELAALTARHLVEFDGVQRYFFHDLVRAYAVDRAALDLPATRALLAVTRMLDYYLHTAHAANALLYPYRQPIELLRPENGVSPRGFADSAQALDWLRAERRAMTAAVNRAAALGLATHAWQLAWMLAEFLDFHGHWYDEEQTNLVALQVAETSCDLAGQAHAHRHLGRAHVKLADTTRAQTHLRRAIELFTSVGDHCGQAATQLTLANIRDLEGDTEGALALSLEALRNFRTDGREVGEAIALNAVGWWQATLGEHDQALTHCQLALEIQQRLGDLPGQAGTWSTLGYTHDRMGNFARAAVCLSKSAELLRAAGMRYLEADTLMRLGDTQNSMGDSASATQAWRGARAIFDEINNPEGTVQERST